jgi:hypothetical protein
MLFKILSLISKILFYELDLGVDVKVANQQWNLLPFQENSSFDDKASLLLNRTLYITQNKVLFSKAVTESLNYETVHFLLTITWLVLGGLFQSLIVLPNLKNQYYIPFIWRVAIRLSSLFLMGPLYVYFFSSFFIVTSKASIPEKQSILLKVGSMIKPGPYGKGYPRGKKTAAGRPPCGRATPQMAV